MQQPNATQPPAAANHAFAVRPATPADTGELHALICALAAYEGRPEAATLTQSALAHWLFERGTAHALIATHKGAAVGYALYYPVFHSFKGTSGLYVEDLFLQPALRGQGLGRAFFAALAHLAKAQGYTGLTFSCLCTNTPSLGFYQALGADESTTHRHFSFEGDAFLQLAAAWPGEV